MAEREAYIPPQLSLAQNGDNAVQTNGATADANNGNLQGSFANKTQQPARFAYGVRREYDTPDKKVHYLCGECGNSNGFAANDPIRCAKCGGRTMYKPRVKQ